MTSNPKRPWFRFHLLTLVLMALTSGLIVRLNITRPKSDPVYGWPIYAVAYNENYPQAPWNFRDDDLEFGDDPTQNFHFGPWEGVGVRWVVRVLLPDALLSLLMIGGVAFVSESIIRRRSARKPP